MVSRHLEVFDDDILLGDAVILELLLSPTVLRFELARDIGQLARADVVASHWRGFSLWTGLSLRAGTLVGFTLLFLGVLREDGLRAVVRV